MSSFICLKNISKYYDMGQERIYALNNISLDIGRGEFVSILGHSGSGKSTLMNIIGCLDKASSGSYNFEEQDICSSSLHKLAKIRGRAIGFIFQEFNLISTMTARENISLPLLYSGMNKSDYKQRADELLAMVGLSDRDKHIPAQLSGGQRQRVAIARALALSPKLILADEPTGNLDERSAGDIMSLLHKIHRDGTTVVMITHDRTLTKNTNRTLKMRDGSFWTK